MKSETVYNNNFANSESIAAHWFTAIPFGSVGKTYGDRFNEIRLSRVGDDAAKVVNIARKLGKGYPSTVYNIERQWRVPNLKTLARHAEALGCQPWDLLDGVVTEYDLVRQLSGLPKQAAEAEWRRILNKYGTGVKKGERSRSSRAPTGRRTA